jgi:hypothetical protein
MGDLNGSFAVANRIRRAMDSPRVFGAKGDALTKLTLKEPEK